MKEPFDVGLSRRWGDEWGVSIRLGGILTTSETWDLIGALTDSVTDAMERNNKERRERR